MLIYNECYSFPVAKLVPRALSYPAGAIKTGRRENLETKYPSVL